MNSKYILIIGLILILIGIIQIPFYKTHLPNSSYVKLSNGIIAYKEYNSPGKTLIAIHGSPGTKNDFKLLAPQIKDYKVYALDMYGFGESEKNVENYGVESQANVINEFMEKLNITNASILGYSWGGGVAAEFAFKYPEKVDKLNLLVSMGIQEGEPTGNHFIEKTRSLISYPFVTYYPGSFAGGIGWRKGFMRSFLDTDLRKSREKFSKINVKTLILHGKDDKVVLPWVAEVHHKLIKNSKLEFFKGGHGELFRNSDEITSKINEFL